MFIAHQEALEQAYILTVIKNNPLSGDYFFYSVAYPF